MRVVAGVYGGRRLVAPAGREVRPTSDKVRAAIFNSLEAHGLLLDASAVDLFAGSGALGLEALSRGAARCTFVEQSSAALRSLRANIDALGVGDRCEVVRADALRWTGPPADLVLADPPYAFDAWAELLDRIDAGHVVAESGRALPAHPRWMNARERTYGGTVVTFLQRLG